MTLPLNKRYQPMEATPASELPAGAEWLYEPKWDGFRCLAFRDAKRIDLLSKAGKPLTRYFPELVAALAELTAKQFVLDGEIVIPMDGGLSFDQLLMRIHPAASRIQKLSQSSPCLFVVFALGLIGACLGGQTGAHANAGHPLWSVQMEGFSPHLPAHI